MKAAPRTYIVHLRPDRGGLHTLVVEEIPPDKLVDPRIVFLARAAARDHLVAAGEMDIDEAINGLLPAFEQLVGVCNCSRRTA
jgi:hypothetical protein